MSSVLTRADIHCPYCGESFETFVDTSTGSYQTIEDCQICCAPIELAIVISPDGEQVDVQARRDDE